MEPPLFFSTFLTLVYTPIIYIPMGRETWRCTFKEPEQQKTNGQSVKLEVKGRWMPEEEGQSAKLEVKGRWMTKG